MKFYQIKPGDERSHVVTGLTVAQVKTLANALLIDIAADEAAGMPDGSKVELLEKLKKLIPE